MKKFLTLFSSVAALATTAATVVGCADRPVDSLANSPIKMKEKNVYDITSWSSDAINAAKYKEHFMLGITEGFKIGKITSLLSFVQNDYKQTDKPFIAVMLEDFNKTANQKLPLEGDADKFTADALAKNLEFSLYDLNKEEQPRVSTWDGTHWDLVKTDEYEKIDKDLSIKYRDDTKAFVISMGIEIKPLNVETGPFVGAKINVGENNKTDALDNFYSKEIKENPEYYNQTTTHKKGEDGNIHFTSKVYDYRYKVQFNFQVS
ncbi:Vmc-like lipoprotein signal peptide domain-containing protein [Williamsoniiplasma luminosum]|uniref:Lipoprotein n=1 Tax=Williamsoniiplasma luminosum TaxID=214888 RepID=A0A2S0NK09_9MOLU|nr:hypothetical protein [Williamsoniiplasma luminosum]AVP49347.1 MAG: hypothetical protein C5T88_01995 [Williamsoniiplasma luminosum]